MKHPTMKVFLDVFLKVNKETHKDNPRVLRRLDQVTMENTEFNGIAEKPAGDNFGRTLAIATPDLKITGTGQDYRRAKLAFQGLHDINTIYTNLNTIFDLYTSGLYLYNASLLENIIPIMKANTDQGHVAAASTQYGTPDAAAWHAFDRDDTTTWTSSDTTNPRVPQWLSMTFPKSEKIYGYTVRGRTAGWINNPKAYEIQGSDDGTTWTKIIDGGLATNNAGEFKTIIFPEPVTYKAYRLFITQNYIDWGASTVCEFELLQTATGLVSMVDLFKLSRDEYAEQVRQQIAEHFNVEFLETDFSIDKSGSSPVVNVNTPTITGGVTVYEREPSLYESSLGMTFPLRIENASVPVVYPDILQNTKTDDYTIDMVFSPDSLHATDSCTILNFTSAIASGFFLSGLRIMMGSETYSNCLCLCTHNNASSEIYVCKLWDKAKILSQGTAGIDIEVRKRSGRISLWVNDTQMELSHGFAPDAVTSMDFEDPNGLGSTTAFYFGPEGGTDNVFDIYRFKYDV